MAAWVIRQEREGEPIDAFQLEEIEVPEPGAFEVVVRVMAAGVNFNNVWAALGQPVSVFRYGDHPEDGHHIGGSDASGHRLEGRRGRHALEGRRRGRPALQPGLLRGSRGPRPRPAGRSFAEDLGLRDDLGLVRPVHEGPGPAASAEAQPPHLGRSGLLRPHLLHRLPHADRPAKLQAGHKVLIWGAAGGLGVFATQLCAAAGADCVGVVSTRREGRARQAARRGRLHQPQRVRRDDAQGRRATEEEKARFEESRRFAKARRGDPRRTRPTSSSSTSARPRSRPRCSP